MVRNAGRLDYVQFDTRRDRRPPTTVTRFTARRQGVTHRLTWNHARDDDRVVAYLIEQRPRNGRWRFEGWYECSPCRRGHRRFRPAEGRAVHVLLPGRRQFRITAVDRAGNYGRPVLSRFTGPSPNT